MWCTWAEKMLGCAQAWDRGLDGRCQRLLTLAGNGGTGKVFESVNFLKIWIKLQCSSQNKHLSFFMMDQRTNNLLQHKQGLSGPQSPQLASRSGAFGRSIPPKQVVAQTSLHYINLYHWTRDGSKLSFVLPRPGLSKELSIFCLTPLMCLLLA